MNPHPPAKFPPKETIRLLITGGTIDCEKIENGDYFFGKTHLPEMLRQGRATTKIRREVLMLKDSLWLTDADRRLILAKCRRQREKRIVITHGTDALQKTAAVLGREIQDKTIVLTGAIIPYNQAFSDAQFNLGAAITAVQLLPAGVYVAMNGRIFHWDNVRKNRRRGVFQSL